MERFWRFWRLCSLLLLLVIVPGHAQTAEKKKTGEELAEIYLDAWSSYDVFPPINDDPVVWTDNSTRPIEVAIGLALVSIDDISPGESEFTVSTRTLIYWKKSECNQTAVHELACNARLQAGKGLKFLSSRSTKGIPSIGVTLPVTDAHSQYFIDNGLEAVQPDLEVYRGQSTQKHVFEMRNYPWEFHEFRVSIASFYTDNVVSLTVLPDLEPDILNPTVPPGWTFHGISCSVGALLARNRATEREKTERFFPTYDCLIRVSRTNPSWWLTSFLVFGGALVMTFVGSLGLTSHCVAEARDDKDAARRAMYDGTRVLGTFTMGMLLTYVFEVEVSPYGQPVEYWPSIPTSTMIYVLGLIAILILSFSGMIGATFLPRPLVREGFVGEITQCYNIEKLPVEGTVPKAGHPLLLKKHCPERSTEEGAPAEGRRADDGQEPPTGTTESCNKKEGDIEKIPNTRKSNQKQYNVMSVEEAILVNKYVRRLFFLKSSIMLVVIVCTLSILLTARGRYNDDMDDASV